MGSTCPLAGRSILVVEDEPLVTLEVAEALSASGAKVVSAVRAAKAIELLESADVAAAVVDIKLDTDDCSTVCQRLAVRGIPFLFYSGYSKGPDGWPDIPIIRKPARPEQIVDAVGHLCGSEQIAA